MMGEFGGIGHAGMKKFTGDYFQEREKRQQENSQKGKEIFKSIDQFYEFPIEHFSDDIPAAFAVIFRRFPC